MAFRSKFQRLFIRFFSLLCLSFILIFDYLYEKNFRESILLTQTTVYKDVQLLQNEPMGPLHAMEKLFKSHEGNFFIFKKQSIINISSKNSLLREWEKYRKDIISSEPHVFNTYEQWQVLKIPLKTSSFILVYAVKSSFFVKMALKNMGLVGVLFLLILIFLFFIRYFILKEFITPAEKLMTFIRDKKEETFTDTLSPWHTWFTSVSMVFDKNKILVQRLENHIRKLDQRVVERTKSLYQKNNELQEALHHLKKAQNQIIVQEKLAGLGAITAGIAHEIKNPLNFILNFATLSRDYLNELKTTKRKKEFIENLDHLHHNLEKIETHANRADSIINSMLLHAHGGNDTLEEVNIHDLLDENSLLVLSSHRQKGLNVLLEKKYNKHVPSLFIYKQDISRVLLNLMNNSCYAMDMRQKSQIDYQPCLTLATTFEKNNVHIFIRDNGTGIPKAIQKKIFNPFFTTKPAGKGTGLGLSLSYDIITHQHMGHIYVKSKVNHFTEFHIILPQKEF